MLPLPPLRRAASLAFVTVCLALPLAVSFGGRHDDLELYGTWAKYVSHGWLPYGDFAVEYPPLATLSILLPGLVSTTRAGFATAFVVSMGVWDAWGKWAMAQSLPKHKRRCFWLVASAMGLILNYILLRRFDPAAALCTALALAGCVARPTALAPFGLLGLGAAIKLYPIILMPGMLVFAWHQHHRRKRALWQGGAVVLALVGPSVVAFAAAGEASMVWLRFHQERGLHVASSLLPWAIIWQGGPGLVLKPEYAFGCTQIAGDLGQRLAHLSPKLTLVAFGATFVGMWPSLKTADGLWRLSCALVCALLLTAKVFSPQYMVWLIGVGAMAAAWTRRGRTGLIGALLLAALCTAQLFPNEARIFMGWRSAQSWLILRTLALWALWAQLVQPLQYWRTPLATQRAIDKPRATRQLPL